MPCRFPGANTNSRESEQERERVYLTGPVPTPFSVFLLSKHAFDFGPSALCSNDRDAHLISVPPSCERRKKVHL